MDPEISYMIAGYYLMSIFFIFMGGLPVKPPLKWSEPRGVAIRSYLYRCVESLAGKGVSKLSPFLSERDKTKFATVWRGNFSYSIYFSVMQIHFLINQMRFHLNNGKHGLSIVI